MAASAAVLATSVEALSENVERFKARDRTNRRIIKVLAVLFALKLATVVILIVALVDLSGANRQVQKSLRLNYATQQQQAQVRIKVLCPLYSVLLASIQNMPPPGAPGTPERSRYDDSARAIKGGYAVLDCTSVTPSPPPAK